MNDNLYKKIDQYQKSNIHLSELIDLFYPILCRYSFLLNQEDGWEEFQICLIEVLKKIPLRAFDNQNPDCYILSYIKKSMHNRYIHLSKKKQDNQNYCICFADVHTVEQDDVSPQLWDLLDQLTNKQKQVVLLEFYQGYNEVEIAVILNVSRQAVNRIKQRAMSRLRRLIALSNDKYDST